MIAVVDKRKDHIQYIQQNHKDGSFLPTLSFALSVLERHYGNGTVIQQ
jgi:hypothetical protein